MKPTTKLQNEVYALSQKLPPITPKMNKWAYDTTLHLHGMISRNRMFCLECGHKWKPGTKEIVELPQANRSTLLIDILNEANQPRKNGPDWVVKCPSCKRKINIHRESLPTVRDASWWGTWTTMEGFQVLRVCTVEKIMAKNKKPEWFSSEDIQYWIHPTGKITLVSRVAPQGWYAHNFTGDLKIRVTGTERRSDYNIDPKHLFEQPVIPEITRNGYKGKLHGIAPHTLFSFILRSQYAETLLKSKQYGLLKYFSNYPERLTDEVWGALRICFRNKYIINEKNSITWLDYIDLLKYFGKDLRNAAYVCPKDLNKAHNTYVRRKQEIDRKVRSEQIRREAIKDQAAYIRDKAKFFDLLFVNEELGLIVEPIKSVDQLFEESDRLHHCAFTSRYHNKKESLMLSARLGDKIMETMEIDLVRFVIVQARGLQNKPSKFNKEFIAMVQSNMDLIKQAMKTKKAKTPEKIEAAKPVAA